MAVSGVIRLSAIIGGVRQTVVDTVHVRARTWPDKPLRLVERYVRCRRAIFNEESCPLLYPPRWISDLAEGRAEPTTDSLGEKRAVIVTSGPNQGWGYVAGATPPIPWDHYTIYYSDLLQTPTAAWWQEQHDPGCYTDAGVASLYAGVMHHERLHYQMLSDLFGGAHDVRANQQLEGLRSYGVSNDEWQQTYLSAINALGEDMMIRSGRNHDYPDVQTWQWDALCRPDLTSHPATNG